jgi:hypothetical protein
VGEHELPPNPDLDDPPDEIAEHSGPFTIEGMDEDRNVWTGPVERIDLARGFADRRRVASMPTRPLEADEAKEAEATMDRGHVRPSPVHRPRWLEALDHDRRQAELEALVHRGGALRRRSRLPQVRAPDP